MSKLDEAREVLTRLNVPKEQRNALCCRVLLALAGIGQSNAWSDASSEWMRIHDIIAFLNVQYGADYAENSRETIRKQALHPFRIAAFVEDNGRVTNSPNYMYRLTDDMLALVRCFGAAEWDAALREFVDKHQTLVDVYQAKRQQARVPVVIDEEELSFARGPHNLLQKEIIDEFGSRFAPGSECLYVGDAEDRDLLVRAGTLRELGIEITTYGKMPDVVLFDAHNGSLFLVEAVVSGGPISPKRKVELEKMVRGANVRRCIYVSAFPDFRTYRKFSDKLAWETEAWIAEAPAHMIHYNGHRFLAPDSRGKV